MSTFDPYDWEKLFLWSDGQGRGGENVIALTERRQRAIINFPLFNPEKRDGNGKNRYENDDGRSFVNIPTLINYYQLHVLKRAVSPSQCQSKLFAGGEILDIIGKPEEGWWTARNALKITGLIPVNHVKLYEEGDEISLQNPSTHSSSGGSCDKRFSTQSTASDRSNKRSSEPDFESIYDLEALVLKKDKIIYLSELLPTGMCRGMTEADGKVGLFPSLTLSPQIYLWMVGLDCLQIVIMDFKFILSNVAGPGIEQEELTEDLEGCSCEDQCTLEAGCSCLKFANANNYDETGCFLHSSDVTLPFFECHSDCLCMQRRRPCRNRIIQLGIRLHLVLSRDKGFGMVAKQQIKAGQFVVEYVGEVISKEEAIRRATTILSEEHNYILAINEHIQGELRPTFIDARLKSNMGRFVNHSCQPNLFPQVFRIGNVVPKLALFALRDISLVASMNFVRLYRIPLSMCLRAPYPIHPNSPQKRADNGIQFVLLLCSLFFFIRPDVLRHFMTRFQQVMAHITKPDLRASMVYQRRNEVSVSRSGQSFSAS
uniref:Uncharacterized protein n=1 Tax=Ditylenchus dipsaci TaxID=166011 RepID=A0A915DJX3_9BILA